MTQQILPAQHLPADVFQLASSHQVATPTKEYRPGQSIALVIGKNILLFLLSIVVAIVGITLIVLVVGFLSQSSSTVLIPVGLGIALLILPLRVLLSGIASTRKAMS